MFSKDDERKLVEGAKENPEEFGKLYDLYLSKIYNFILARVNNKAVAEDITSEVFLSCLKHINGFKWQGSFASWIFKVARNKLIDYYRSYKTLAPIENTEISFESKQDEELDKDLEISAVRKLIKGLTKEQQEVIILRYQQDLQISEIAQILDKSEGAIKLLLNRAIKKLRKELQKHNLL